MKVPRLKQPSQGPKNTEPPTAPAFTVQSEQDQPLNPSNQTQGTATLPHLVEQQAKASWPKQQSQGHQNTEPTTVPALPEQSKQHKIAPPSKENKSPAGDSTISLNNKVSIEPPSLLSNLSGTENAPHLATQSPLRTLSPRGSTAGTQRLQPPVVMPATQDTATWSKAPETQAKSRSPSPTTQRKSPPTPSMGQRAKHALAASHAPLFDPTVLHQLGTTGQPSPSRNTPSLGQQATSPKIQQALSPGGARGTLGSPRLQPGQVAHSTGQDPKVPAAVKAVEMTAQETLSEATMQQRETPAGVTTTDPKASATGLAAMETTAEKATTKVPATQESTPMGTTAASTQVEETVLGTSAFPPKGTTPRPPTPAEAAGAVSSPAPAEVNRKRSSCSPTHSELGAMDTEATKTAPTVAEQDPPAMLRQPLSFLATLTGSKSFSDSSPKPPLAPVLNSLQGTKTAGGKRGNQGSPGEQAVGPSVPHQSKRNKDSEAAPMDTEQHHQGDSMENEQEQLHQGQCDSARSTETPETDQHQLQETPAAPALEQHQVQQSTAKATDETQHQDQPEDWPEFLPLDKTKPVTKKLASASKKGNFDPLPASAMNLGTRMPYLKQFTASLSKQLAFLEVIGVDTTAPGFNHNLCCELLSMNTIPHSAVSLTVTEAFEGGTIFSKDSFFKKQEDQELCANFLYQVRQDSLQQLQELQ